MYTVLCWWKGPTGGGTSTLGGGTSMSSWMSVGRPWSEHLDLRCLVITTDSFIVTSISILVNFDTGIPERIVSYSKNGKEHGRLWEHDTKKWSNRPHTSWMSHHDMSLNIVSNRPALVEFFKITITWWKIKHTLVPGKYLKIHPDFQGTTDFKILNQFSVILEITVWTLQICDSSTDIILTSGDSTLFEVCVCDTIITMMYISIVFKEFRTLGKFWTLTSRRSKTHHPSSLIIWSIWIQYFELLDDHVQFLILLFVSLFSVPPPPLPGILASSDLGFQIWGLTGSTQISRFLGET